MKSLVVFFLLLMTAACATEGKFEAKLRTWRGRDADTVVRWWGQPDSTEKLSNGDRMYVYARIHHPPIAFGDTDGTSTESETKRTAAASEVYIHCSSYFEIDPQGKVSAAYYRGEDCSSRD